jgi:purine-nucleoside phosphorylase
MKVLGISVITDACVPEDLKPVNISEIIKTAKEAEPKLTKLMRKVISEL